MVLHNPNNWHWVNKDVREWAREYLEKSLVGIDAQSGDTSAAISSVKTMDGDVDVSQRKGKVITLFDVKVELEYTGQSRSSITPIMTLTKGSTKDEPEVSGTISIPEVAHDTEEDEYVVGCLLTALSLGVFG